MHEWYKGGPPIHLFNIDKGVLGQIPDVNPAVIIIESNTSEENKGVLISLEISGNKFHDFLSEFSGINKRNLLVKFKSVQEKQYHKMQRDNKSLKYYGVTSGSLVSLMENPLGETIEEEEKLIPAKGIYKRRPQQMPEMHLNQLTEQDRLLLTIKASLDKSKSNPNKLASKQNKSESRRRITMQIDPEAANLLEDNKQEYPKTPSTGK